MEIFQFCAELNWLAIAVCVVVGNALGALWHSPLLFAQVWMRLTGMSEKDIEGTPMAPLLLQETLWIIVRVVGLALLLKATGASTLEAALGIIAVVWLAFGLGGHASNGIWEKRPWGLIWINSGLALTSMLIWAVILTMWV